MTLHQAIENLLRQACQPMTTQQIADELNENGWYRRKDGSAIQADQIHNRSRNYPTIFVRDGSRISLNWDTQAKMKETKKALIPISLHTKKSFEPISNADTRILILGTIPGDKSLELGEYYGHSRNRFWKIIAAITRNDLPVTYSSKKELLLKSNIGVWDVAHSANRVGSLDAAIKHEMPNDLDKFISSHKKIKVIGFNGKKAEALFDKYFARKAELTYFSLPSTSPANTGIDFEESCKQWRQILSRS